MNVKQVLKFLVLLYPTLLLGASSPNVTSLQKGLVVDMPLTSGYLHTATLGSTRVPDNIRSLTLVGTAAWGADGLAVDGNSDYMRYGVTDWRGSDSAGTMNVWFYNTNATDYSAVVATGWEAGETRYTIFGFDVPSGEIRLRIRDGANHNQIDGTSCGTATLQTSTWQMITASSDDSSYSLYLDGQACSLTESIEGFVDGDWFNVMSNTQNFVIGALVRVSKAIHLEGKARNFKQWNRALTQAEVTDLYNQGPGVYAIRVDTGQPDLKVEP